MPKNANQEFYDNVTEAITNYSGDINTKMDLLQAEFELEQKRNDELELKVNRGGLGGGGGPIGRDSKERIEAWKSWAKTGDEKVGDTHPLGHCAHQKPGH